MPPRLSSQPAVPGSAKLAPQRRRERSDTALSHAADMTTGSIVDERHPEEVKRPGALTVLRSRNANQYSPCGCIAERL